MRTTFHLPDLGEGLTESQIVAWQVAEGDEVELNQIIAEVETAKAVVDLPSPHAGRIAKLHASPGQTLAVGAPLVDFQLPGAPETASDDDTTGAAGPSQRQSPPPAAQGSPSASTAAEPKEPASAGADERQSVLVGYGPKVDAGARPTRRPRSFETVPYRGRGPGQEQSHTPRAMPPVRALARSLGVDLATVSGTGPAGLIQRADIEAAAHTPTEPASAAPRSAGSPAPPAGSTYVPVTGLRKHTARAMTDSAFTAPHAAVFSTVDVTATMDLVRRGRAKAREQHEPSFLALAGRAVVLAARRTPGANARFDAEASHIEHFGHLTLGIAVATERGLVVAGITGADQLDAAALTEQIATQAARAREGSLSLAELTSSTLTITNVGVFGVDGGIPILNPGESVIVALGTVRTQPWEHQGQVALREVVTVTVSFDHRVLDGAQASAFLADITEVLSTPAIALTR